jgi:site-specific DNA-cytosine methylase
MSDTDFAGALQRFKDAALALDRAWNPADGDADAFHGAGGWAEGLRELGRESVGVEYDPDMVATSRAAGHEVVLADVAAIDPRELVPEGERCEGVIASPPCPSFSNGGKQLGRRTCPRSTAWWPSSRAASTTAPTRRCTTSARA